MHVDCKNVRISDNQPDLFVVYDKRKKKTLEVEKTCQDKLQTVNMEKMRKYGVLINDLGHIYEFSDETISYVLIWDRILLRYHRKHILHFEIYSHLLRHILGSQPLPMDGGAWQAAVHGVAKSWTRLSDFPFTFHFHALEKEMATHSSVLAWRIPGTEECGGLLSMGVAQSRTRLK